MSQSSRVSRKVLRKREKPVKYNEAKPKAPRPAKRKREKKNA